MSAGGGFGIKGEFYPEDFLIPWAARRVRRPVAWVEDRREHLLTADHSRDQRHQAVIAGTADGDVTAVMTRFWLDGGAYVRTVGTRVGDLTMGALVGPYDIPQLRGHRPLHAHEQDAVRHLPGARALRVLVRDGAPTRPVRGPRRPRSGRDPPPQPGAA